ncbi:hypothetical protein BH23VER1_BH23VER1_03480 [soil metagenome]
MDTMDNSMNLMAGREALELALYVGGALHFCILIASALTPFALDWKKLLEPLPNLLRQMFWVYGAFIVLTITSFGALTMLHAQAMAYGDAIGRSLCGVIAIFWAARLAVQLFLFDAKPFLTRWFWKAGYHALTVCFIAMVAIFTWGALA